jgi:predicted ATPase/DNA-binding SARP family transcriptional activator
MPLLSISVLGPLQVTLADAPVNGFEYNKVRALLAYLAVEAGAAHPRAELCALLWPDLPEKTARRNLTQALTTLRHALGEADRGPHYLLATHEAVEINGEVRSDVTGFNALLDQSERHAHRSWHTCSECAGHLREAMALYRGDFLSQLSVPDSIPFEEWALLWRERLRQRALSALERLAQRAEWCGDYRAAASHARRMVELDSLRESGHRELIRLLALDGQWSAAEAQYEHLRRTLQSELAAEPEAETVELRERMRTRAHGKLRRFEPPPFHCPEPPNALIGRAAELVSICTQLREQSVRVLTLTGTPGLGKTRLALEAAHMLRFDFEDGLHFIELAPVAEAAGVPSAIAQQLNVKERPGQTLAETLTTHLKPKHSLLVLDNFEHVLEAAAFIAELLAACPAAKVLITSRAPLLIRAERQHTVAPLAATDSVQLFVERVRALQPAFTPTEAQRVAIVELCARLDHLPLAIELIAVRARSLSPAELLQQLEHRLSALGAGPRDLPERQRSLRGAIAWSYDLLSAEEQRVFASLGVFAGGGTLEAMQAVVGEAASVLPALEALARASLVQTHSVAGETRFLLLETIREYALGQLAARGDLSDAQQRHAEYFTHGAELARHNLGSAQQEPGFRRLTTDLDNLRAALQWAVTRPAPLILVRLTTALYHFWWRSGLVNEGLRWMEMALLQRDVAPLELQAELLVNVGVLAVQCDDYAKAYAHLLKGLELARRIGHRRLTRGALANLGNLALLQGHFDQVEPYLAEAIQVTRAINDEAYARYTLTVLADLHYRMGRFEAASEAYGQALEINRQHDDREGEADSLWGLARAARGLGNLPQAARYSDEAMALYRALDHELGMGWVVNVRANIASEAGQLDEALRLYHEALTIRLKHDDKQGCSRVLDEAAHTFARLYRWTRAVQILSAADHVRTALGGRMTEFERQAREAVLRDCRAALEREKYESVWETGRALTLSQTVALVG